MTDGTGVLGAEAVGHGVDVGQQQQAVGVHGAGQQGGEQRVVAVDGAHVQGLPLPGGLGHRVDRDPAVDPAGVVPGEQVVGQRGKQEVIGPQHVPLQALHPQRPQVGPEHPAGQVLGQPRTVQVREQLAERADQPGAGGVAPQHQQGRQRRRDHDAEPGRALAVGPAERPGEQPVVSRRPRHLGGDQGPADQRPEPGGRGQRGDQLPGPGAMREDHLKGTDERRSVIEQRVVRDQAHDRGRHGQVHDGGGAGTQQRGAADVAARILDPLGADRRRFDPDEREQRHPGGDPDRRVQAAARGVERAEVGLGDEEPARSPTSGPARGPCAGPSLTSAPVPGAARPADGS